MDIQKIVEAAHDFTLLYDDYERSRKKLSYQVIKQPLNPMIFKEYWVKEYGAFADGEEYGLFSLEKEGLSSWREDEKGNIVAFWSTKTKAYEIPEISERTKIHVGDWCELKSQKEHQECAAEYEASMIELKTTPFEDYLKGLSMFDRFLRVLLSKNLTVRCQDVAYPAAMVKEGCNIKRLSEDRAFELAAIRVMAGALIVYLDTLRFVRRGIKAGAVKVAKPSPRTRKAATALLAALEMQSLKIDADFRWSLERLEYGVLEPSRLSIETTTDLRRKGLIREVCLLSKQIFKTSNGKPKRFPVAAIQSILAIIGDDAEDVSVRTIIYNQKLYDNSEEFPLTHPRLYPSLNLPKVPF